jgi:hypothetical protein
MSAKTRGPACGDRLREFDQVADGAMPEHRLSVMEAAE